MYFLWPEIMFENCYLYGLVTCELYLAFKSSWWVSSNLIYLYKDYLVVDLDYLQVV